MDMKQLPIAKNIQKTILQTLIKMNETNINKNQVKHKQKRAFQKSIKVLSRLMHIYLPDRNPQE